MANKSRTGAAKMSDKTLVPLLLFRDLRTSLKSSSRTSTRWDRNTPIKSNNRSQKSRRSRVRPPRAARTRSSTIISLETRSHRLLPHQLPHPQRLRQASSLRASQRPKLPPPLPPRLSPLSRSPLLPHRTSSNSRTPLASSGAIFDALRFLRSS